MKIPRSSAERSYQTLNAEISRISDENLKPRPITDISNLSAESPKQDRNAEIFNISAEKLSAELNMDISRISAEKPKQDRKVENSNLSAEKLPAEPNVEILRSGAEKPVQIRNVENPILSAENPQQDRNVEILNPSAEKLAESRNMEISNPGAERLSVEIRKTSAEKRQQDQNMEISILSAENLKLGPNMEISNLSAENAPDKLAEIHAKLLPLQHVLASGGHVRSYWKNHRGTRFGPYYRVVYQHDGRRQSLYLGSDPLLADQVTRLLENWQRGRLENLYLRSLRKKIRAALRHEMANLDEFLAPLGFRRKGYAFHRVHPQKPIEP